MMQDSPSTNEEDSTLQSKCTSNILIKIIIVVAILLGLVVATITLGVFYHECNESKSEANNNNDNDYKPSYNKYKLAAIAADAGPCSTIGKDLLKNGSAVDAAIGTALCVSVLNTHSNSIGGGSFISIYDASTGDALYINARDVAPAKANKTMYYQKGKNASEIGALSIAVPGEIAGYWEAHKRYKKLDWKKVFQPTINLALNYPKITKSLGKALYHIKDNLFNSDFNLEPIFVDENGSVKVENETVARAEIGTTLRHIADAANGSEAFYKGAIAKRIVQDLKDASGESIITEQDLKNYKVEVKDLIKIELGNLTVLTPGAPSGGPVLAYILNILKGYNFTPEDLKNEDAEILAYHRILEAFKFAYAKRAELGDPNFDDTGDVEKAVQDMINEEYANDARRRINDSYTQPAKYYGPSDSIPPEDSGTTHISVLGEDGSAVAITSSMNHYLGSKVRGLRTGIIFNNMMADFTIESTQSNMSKNFIEGGKRPLSSMAPTIIIKQNETNGKAVKIVIGASGGIKIPTATALTIMQMLWFGKNLDDAVKAPRLHSWKNGSNFYETLYEKGKFSNKTLDGLRNKGHKMNEYLPHESVVQAIWRQNSEIEAKSDNRKGGYPDGY